MEAIKNLARGINVLALVISLIFVIGLILGHIFGEPTSFTMFLWCFLGGIISGINTIALFSDNSPK